MSIDHDSGYMTTSEASAPDRSETDPPSLPSPRRWTVLAVISTSLLLCGIDLTVLHASVPSMSRDLQPSAVELLWIVDIYSLALACLLVTCGTLGDRIGRKRMVLSGFAMFGLASSAAAFSGSTLQLIAARLALGIGAAMIMASTVAIIRVVFIDARERVVAIGVWTSAHSVGAAVGPLIGGLVTERWGWGAVFLVNVPIVVTILIVGAQVIPESKNPTPRHWDLASVALSIAGLAGIVYALKRLGETTRVNYVIIVIAVGGSLLLYTFVRRQRRLAEPLLDFSLFADRRFSTATVCVIGCFGSYVALLFFLTQWLQQVGDYSPLQAGLALMPLAAANAVGATTAPWVSARCGNRWALTMALGAFATALALLSVVNYSSQYRLLLGPLLVAGFGAGVVMTLGADTIMGAAHPERTGEAAAIQETSFELGAGLGVAVLGTVLTTVYRITLPSVPNLSSEQKETAQASFADAEGLMDGLDPETARRLLDATRHAYDRGFATVAAVAAGGLMITALLAALLLRPRHPERTEASKSELSQ